jgi:DNA-binding XRE family transcriptional regulator
VEELLNTFGQMIKDARQVAGMTQEGLAEQAGVTTRYIMAIENENRQPIRALKTLRIRSFIHKCRRRSAAAVLLEVAPCSHRFFPHPHGYRCI